MFKRMRNKMLITNMIIIIALVMSCLAAIQVTTNSYLKGDINERLDRELNMQRRQIVRIENGEKMPEMRQGMRPMRGGRDEFPLIDANGEPIPEDMRPPDGEMVPDMFNSEIGIICDTDGNIIETHMMFDLEGLDLGDTVKGIIDSGKTTGSVTLDVDSWAYKIESTRIGYSIALTKNEAERNIIFRLNIMLAIAAILSIGITFLISLFSANRSIKPIEESYNKQKQFVADASHELRTPLASIRANIDVLLSKNESLGAENKKWLEYIKDEAERMTKLTNDLLTLARTDADEGKKIYPEISFSDIVEDVLLENEAIAFENGVELAESVEEGISITAPPEGLKQLVLILIDNAIKYTPNGGRIDVCLKRDGDKAMFTVENDGEINADDLPHIFERFYRADKSRARESGGYGLGLSIASSLCRSLGGMITAASEKGKTRFTVVL